MHMEPMFFVMAILGCGDGNGQCTTARTVPTHYTTMAQCQAALPTQLAANTDIPFPVISADCRRQGVEVAQAGSKPRARG